MIKQEGLSTTASIRALFSSWPRSKGLRFNPHQCHVVAFMDCFTMLISAWWNKTSCKWKRRQDFKRNLGSGTANLFLPKQKKIDARKQTKQSSLYIQQVKLKYDMSHFVWQGVKKDHSGWEVQIIWWFKNKFTVLYQYLIVWKQRSILQPCWCTNPVPYHFDCR